MPERGRKPVGIEIVEEVVTTMVDNDSSSIYSLASGRSVSRELNILWLAQPFLSDYVIGWCGFTAEFILGFFFFRTPIPQGPKICSVTSSRYSKLLYQQIIPALQERQGFQTTIFMQDGTTSHFGRKVKALLTMVIIVKYPEFSGSVAFSFTRHK
ncbi:uncharacterized protein TNCV_2814871 [Trichonephila clavipes]|nr:uncharacterized protein TNCV_2814871 [Trichonephila clavipes]